MSTLRASTEPATLTAPWDELAERLDAGPFVRPGWVTAWWRAYGRGRLELRALWRADGRLAALLPLRCGRGVRGSPTNWHTPEFGFLAESPAAERALLAGLFDERPRRVALGFLAPQQAAALGAAAGEHGYRVLRRTLQRSPAVDIEHEPGWEGYLGGLGRNLRGDLGRRARRLAALGTVALEVTCGEELEERLAEGCALEASGWKGRDGTAMRSRAADLGFYGEVARWAAARGWLRLAFLRLDGRALAFDYCLELGGRHYMLKTGYDATRAELGAGKLLRQAMLERAFRAGLRSYELLGADEPWKLQWARAVRVRELVQAFAPTVPGRLDYVLFAHGRPLVRALRERARRRAPAGKR